MNKTKTLFLSSLTCIALVNMASAAEPKISARIQEQWSCVFGGGEVVFHARVSSPDAFEGRLGWRFFEDARTIERGELNVSIGAGMTDVAEIRFMVPEVKPGVIYEAKLALSLIGENDKQEAADDEIPIRIFTENPFHDRMKWLEGLDIIIFDPEETTGEALSKLDVPFKPVKNIDALAGMKKGFVIIGEGVSMREYRALPEQILRLASDGATVLCLAPADGEIPLAGVDGLVEPSFLAFRREDIIRNLDKRLDAKTWPPDGKLQAGGLKLTGERGVVLAQMTDDAAAWPWIEARFGKGRIVICCFSIMEKWESGPTPRFLLERILSYLNEEIFDVCGH